MSYRTGVMILTIVATALTITYYLQKNQGHNLHQIM